MTPALSSGGTEFAARFQKLRGSLPGARQAWADILRAEGMARFEKLGLPTRKTEAWKYTDLRKLAKTSFEVAPRHVNGLAAPLEAELEAIEPGEPAIVLVNGYFRADLSRLGTLPPGVQVSSLADLLDAGEPMLASRLGKLMDADGKPLLSLNAALMQDGYVLHLAPHTVVERPIRILFLAEGQASPMAFQPRNLIVAEANSQATLIETHRGVDGSSYLSNGVTEIDLANGARLRHYKLQREGAGGIHLANLLVLQAEGSAYDSFILSTGAELARNEIHVLLNGRKAHCRLSGAYLGGGNQLLDTTSLIDHAVPDCTSREVYKGVLDDKARGVFQGKIIVRRDAQRTDGYQLNRALLLSRQAEVDTKPELEIYADDVKCSHGATVGEIDRAALFYLRSRGIDEASARALLVEAFVQEALEEIEVETVRAEFGTIVRRWMAEARVA